MKKIYLLFGLLLLSGCTFEYDLTINPNEIIEDNKVYIEESSKESINNDIEQIVNKYTGPTNSLGMYEQSVISKDNIFGMSYKKEYSLNEYNDNSVSFNQCFDFAKLVTDQNEIIIATSTGFNCFDKYSELENVTVRITTNYNVLSSNADTISRNKYIWNITKENANSKQINITLNKNEYKEKDSDVSIVIVVGAVLVFLIGIIIVIKFGQKGKKK